MIIPVNIPSEEYEIVLERGSLEKASEYLNLNRKVLIVTDSGVPCEYANKVLSQCPEGVLVTLPEGEKSKNKDNLFHLFQVMIDNSFTRKDACIALGGGMCGDIAAFAASCYMRGIEFYNMPTTLLSQVDSSVGGKTAIDFAGIKNIIGSFYQPSKVIIDPNVLDTLDDRKFACGISEVIKMALCFDESLFELIEKSDSRSNIEEIIARSLRIKASVVEKDEKEAGLRKALNFGHTIGHGIESFSKLSHGEAVALGMLPMCSEKVRKRLIPVLKKENLPETTNISFDDIIEAVMHDKKSEGNKVTTVNVAEAGSFVFETDDRDSLAEKYKKVF